MNSLKQEDIYLHYVFDELISSDYYSSIYKAYNRETDQIVAIKQIEKLKIQAYSLKNIQNQYQLLSKLQHPNIIRIYEAFDYQQSFYIVMEYLKGGDICDWVHQLPTRDQKVICDLIKIIADVLKYCHSNGIVHRDLRPQNIIMSNLDGDYILKITDFGMAKIVGQSLLTTVCGSPMFFAPEVILLKPYDFSVDYWSLGILLYILLCGRPPFRGKNQSEIEKKILAGKVQFPEQDWKYISSSAKDLVIKLLEIDPKKRFNSERIHNHPWIVSGGAPLEHPDLISNLLKYSAQRKLQKIQNLVKIELSFTNESFNSSRMWNESMVVPEKNKRKK